MQITKLIHKPAHQAILFLALSIPGIFILSPDSSDDAWIIAGYGFYGYLLLNITVLWFSLDAWRYFFHSICFSIAYLLLLAILMPNIIQQMHLKGASESAMVFLVVIYHPIGLLLIMMAKWISYKLMR